MEVPIDWLLDGPAYLHHRVHIDLLDLPADDRRVSSGRDRMLDDPRVGALMRDVTAWPGPALRSHKDAAHPLHKLVFLADLGVTRDDPAMSAVIERILASAAPEGPTQLLVNVPTHFGGTGRDEEAWFLCDAPSTLYSLASFGMQDDPVVQAAGTYLLGLLRENGWPCAASPRLGRFRGPGRKGDSCPYATLIMLKALSVVPAWRTSPAARAGVEALLGLWQRRKEAKPYLFAMGTDFARLKAPHVWYGLLHVLDVLTRFEWSLADRRLIEMVELLRSQADAAGRFTAGSVWMAWRDWDFGQKREPSPWITLVAHRILRRVD